MFSRIFACVVMFTFALLAATADGQTPPSMLEAHILQKLTRDGRLAHPGWEYEITVKRVEGKRLFEVEATGPRSLRMKASDAIVWMEGGTLFLKLNKVAGQTEDSAFYVEEKVWPVELPRNFP